MVAISLLSRRSSCHWIYAPVLGIGLSDRLPAKSTWILAIGSRPNVIVLLSPSRPEHSGIHADCVTLRRVSPAARAFELENCPLAGQDTGVQDPAGQVLTHRSKGSQWACAAECQFLGRCR